MAICRAEADTFCWPMADFIRPGMPLCPDWEKSATVPKFDGATVSDGTSSGIRWLNPYAWAWLTIAVAPSCSPMKAKSASQDWMTISSSVPPHSSPW